MTETSDEDPLYLSFGTADGSEHTIRVTAAGPGLRLAVGSLNERSSIWRVTALRNDVYITAAGLGQRIKLSLHESGVWRQAYLTEQLAIEAGAVGKPEFNNDPRVMDRWEEPEGDNGWMHALTVWVPHGHLTPLPDERENAKKPITFLPAPDPEHEVGLHFVIVRPDEGEIDPKGMGLVDGFRLPNKRALMVLTSTRAVHESRAQWMEDMSVAALAVMQGNHIRHFGDPLRVGLFMTGEDGNRSVLDLRAPSKAVLDRVNRTGLTVSTTYRPPEGEAGEGGTGGSTGS